MMVRARDLAYGTPDGKPLARGVEFELGEGELLVVRGPNGSGKSTLLRVLLGHLKPTAGALEVGVPRRRIAVLPQLQNTEFHLPMTLRDVLEVSLKRRLRGGEVVDVGLLDAAQLDLSWNTASGGERKRTLLTRLLLESPELLLLDEPMNHLDPESRERVRKAVLGFVAGSPGRSVVLVSHEGGLEEAPQDVRIKSLTLGAAS